MQEERGGRRPLDELLDLGRSLVRLQVAQVAIGDAFSGAQLPDHGAQAPDVAGFGARSFYHLLRRSPPLGATFTACSKSSQMSTALTLEAEYGRRDDGLDRAVTVHSWTAHLLAKVVMVGIKAWPIFVEGTCTFSFPPSNHFLHNDPTHNQGVEPGTLWSRYGGG